MALGRERSIRRLTGIIRAGLATAVLGAVWTVWPAQDADTSFRPAVDRPAFNGKPWPRVVIDEGHYNVHTGDGRYRPFAQLLVRDGFRVLRSEGLVTADVLRGADVFVTANPLGFKGLIEHLASLASLARVVRLNVGAFSPTEIRVLADWIARGGRALILADHAPAGAAARALAAAFGVGMTTWWVEDEIHHDPGSQNPGVLVFSRENGLLLDHPITTGRDARERVSVVMTFTGQALQPPPQAAVLLQLSPSAREYPFRVSRAGEGRSAAGLAQAVAIRHGEGRVVVLGEAAALTAQVIRVVGGPAMAMGMNRQDTDNQQFALNIMRWLMGVLE